LIVLGPVSALGHKRTLERLYTMSALPPKANVRTQSRHFRFVPKADIPMSRSDVSASLFGRRRISKLFYYLLYPEGARRLPRRKLSERREMLCDDRLYGDENERMLDERKPSCLIS
jgi:hypothetical protein